MALRATVRPLRAVLRRREPLSVCSCLLYTQMTEGEHTDTRLAEVEARKREIERRMEQDRERLKHLRAKALRLSGEQDESLEQTPRQMVMTVLGEVDGAVNEEHLVTECVDLGASAESVRDALETLKRRGEVYVPRDGEVRKT